MDDSDVGDADYLSQRLVFSLEGPQPERWFQNHENYFLTGGLDPVSQTYVATRQQYRLFIEVCSPRKLLEN